MKKTCLSLPDHRRLTPKNVTWPMPGAIAFVRSLGFWVINGPRRKVHGPNMSKPKTRQSFLVARNRYIYTCLGGGNSNKFWNFHPECLGFHDPIWLAHIFQMGWFKHQLDIHVHVLFSGEAYGSIFPRKPPSWKSWKKNAKQIRWVLLGMAWLVGLLFYIQSRSVRKWRSKNMAGEIF